MKAVLRVVHSSAYRVRHLLRHLLRPDTRRALRLASTRYQASTYRVLLRVVQLYWLDRFRPDEALSYGLADPGVPIEERERFLSEERLHGMQIAINSPSAAICRDKLVFHSFCRDHGLPVPDLFGVVSPFGSSSGRGEPLTTREKWVEFVARELPAEVIVKPREGRQGRDVRLLASGSPSTVEELRRLEAGDEDWLIQQRLIVHERIAWLTGTHAISSVRVVTLIGEDGNVEIMTALFRVITGDSIVDNTSDYASGRLSGNIVASLDPASGRLLRAWQPNPDGVGYRVLDSHPETGHQFEGFMFPEWDAICGVLKDAARRFAPIRTVGWDVASTVGGPMLIEANERYQSISFGPETQRLRLALQKEHERLRPVSERVSQRYQKEQP